MLEKLKGLFKRGSEHIYYVGATVISAGIHFFYSVFVKAHIEPLEYGIYSTCLLLQTYMTYVQFGCLNAFNRDYPQLIGASNKEKAKRYRNTTFTFLLLAFGVTTVIISAFILVISGSMDSRYAYGMILCAVTTMITVLENFLSSRVRIDGDFKYTSYVVVAELIFVGIGFVLIPKIGYYGLYIVTIGSMLIGIGLYYKRGIADLILSIDKSLLKTMIVSGIPLLINSLIWTVVNSIDKFVILGFISTEKLGIYSIAQMAFSYMILIPNAMSQLFYVRLGKIYGATESVDKLNNTADRYTTIVSSVVSIIVICAYYFIGPLVDSIMPKYSSGVKAAQILLIGLSIYAPAMLNGNILTILKKNAALLRGSIYLCILNTICSIGLIIFWGATIENVARGTAISYLLQTLILVYQLKHNTGRNVCKLIKATIIPVLVSAGPGIIIYHLIDNRYLGFAMAVIIAFVVTYFVYGRKIKSALRNC